jgi:hypothetical protein
MNKPFLIAVSGIVLLTESAQAAPVEPGRFAGSISAGAEFSIDGDVHGGATSSVPLSAVAALRDAGAPPLTLPAGASGAELRIQSRSFDEIYGDAMNITLQGAYGLEGNREILLGLGYTSAGEGSVEVGTAAVVSGSGATLVEVPVNGTFGDYKAWVVEAGLRQYFGGGAFKPYIAGRVGAAFVNDIRASFSVPALDINAALNNVPFYDSTTVLTGGIDLGVSYDVSDNFSLQVETGIRFAGGLDGNDANIGGLGLASINEEGSRTVIPVSVRARWVF